MNHKKLYALPLALFAAAALSLSGCSDAGSKPAAEEKPATDTKTTAAESPTANPDYPEGVTDSTKKATLDDWNGSFRSFASYTDEAFTQDALKKLAEKKGQSVDEVKTELKKGGKTDFEGMVVKDGTVTFVAKPTDIENPSEKPVTYKFTKALDVKTEKFTYTWFIFETSDDAAHKMLAMMPLHGEEKMEHFHCRYGQSLDDILKPADDGWYPTFVNVKKVTEDQIKSALESRGEH